MKIEIKLQQYVIKAIESLYGQAVAPGSSIFTENEERI